MGHFRCSLYRERKITFTGGTVVCDNAYSQRAYNRTAGCYSCQLLLAQTIPQKQTWEKVQSTVPLCPG